MSARTRTLSTTVALTGAALVLALVGSGGTVPETAGASAPHAARPLDDVPGMGMSPDAVARDETISYWEAWRRDVSVQSCMRRASFEWDPEVSYPSEAVVLVAGELGVPPSPDPGEDPAARNARRVAALSATERNRYFTTLNGESAATIAFVESHDGALPPAEAADDFATGGCRGAADKRIGSLWALRRQLGRDLTARVNAARKAPEFVAEQGKYHRCAAQQGLPDVQTPSDVDRALEQGDEQAAMAVEARCSVIWRNADEAALGRAAHGFRNHEVDLDFYWPTL